MIIMKTPTQCQNANREEGRKEGRVLAGHTWHTAPPTAQLQAGRQGGQRWRAAQWVLLKFQKFLCATLTAVRAVAGREGQRRPEKALAAVCPGRQDGRQAWTGILSDLMFGFCLPNWWRWQEGRQGVAGYKITGECCAYSGLIYT